LHPSLAVIKPLQQQAGLFVFEKQDGRQQAWPLLIEGTARQLCRQAGSGGRAGLTPG
jgi:hypothetical protein